MTSLRYYSYSVNTKRLILKVPNYGSSGSKPLSIVNDSTFCGDDESEEILLNFIQPKEQGRSIAKNKKRNAGHDEGSNLKALMENFNVPEFDQLPLVKPPSLVQQPYEFLVKNNSDLSIVNTPRLSVTKLLTKLWCELRQYYDVYSGSLPRKETAEMALGTLHHENLEISVHERIDVTGLEIVLIASKNSIEAQLEGLISNAKAVNDEKMVQTLTEEREAMLKLLLGGCLASNRMAQNWLSGIIGKLFHLVTTGQAREVLVHAYLSFDREELVEVPDEIEIQTDAVLVSGIIDNLEIKNISNPNDLSMFEDISNYVEYHFPSGTGVDLGRLISEVGNRISEYDDVYKLNVIDVKTRSRKLIPTQASVLTAAKLQVANYKKYLEILSSSESMAYLMLIQNAKRRGCDLDEPIGLEDLIKMVKTNGQILLEDFRKLAKGEPIGFQEYDEYVKEKYIEGTENSGYDLLKIYDPSGIFENGIEVEDINLEGILKNWKIPLTLRYFAARSSQLYSLLGPLITSSSMTSIEYHHNKTGECFKKIDYEYNDEEFKEELRDSVQFWKGSRPPNLVDDVSKCKWCEFEPRCSIPNPHLSFSLGDRVKALCE